MCSLCFAHTSLFLLHSHSLPSWVFPLDKPNCPNFDTSWCLLPSHLTVLHLLVPPAPQTHTYFHSLCICQELYQYCSLFCHCWNFRVQIQPPPASVLTHLTLFSLIPPKWAPSRLTNIFPDPGVTWHSPDSLQQLSFAAKSSSPKTQPEFLSHLEASYPTHRTLKHSK